MRIKFFEFVTQKMKEKLEKDEEFKELSNLEKKIYKYEVKSPLKNNYGGIDKSKEFHVKNLEQAQKYIVRTESLIPMLKQKKDSSLFLKSRYEKKYNFASLKLEFCKQVVYSINAKENQTFSKAYKEKGGLKRKDEILINYAFEVIKENLAEPEIEWGLIQAIDSRGCFRQNNNYYPEDDRWRSGIVSASNCVAAVAEVLDELAVKIIAEKDFKKDIDVIKKLDQNIVKEFLDNETEM